MDDAQLCKALRERATDETGRWDVLEAGHVDVASDRIEELASIVGRLPRTADGYPIWLGRTLYTARGARGVIGCGYIMLAAPDGPDDEWWGTVRDEDGGQFSLRASDAYASREAAMHNSTG